MDYLKKPKSFLFFNDQQNELKFGYKFKDNFITHLNVFKQDPIDIKSLKFLNFQLSYLNI